MDNQQSEQQVQQIEELQQVQVQPMEQIEQPVQQIEQPVQIEQQPVQMEQPPVQQMEAVQQMQNVQHMQTVNQIQSIPMQPVQQMQQVYVPGEVQIPKPKRKPARRTGPVRRSSKGGWKVNEDNLLREAVRKYNAKNWKKIAELVPNRTHIQCLHRWQKVLNPELIKGKWTSDEDENLKTFFKMYGENWPIIAQKIVGRNSKQCRERYYNHLAPSVKKGAWSEEEEKLLMSEQARIGNKWAEISKRIPGRTQNACKNQYHKMQNRKSKKSSRRRYKKKNKVLPQTATAEVNTAPINQMFYQYQFQPIQFYQGEQGSNPQQQIKMKPQEHINIPVVEQHMMRQQQDMLRQLAPSQRPEGLTKEQQMQNFQKQQEVYRQYQALLTQQHTERQQFISAHFPTDNKKDKMEIVQEEKAKKESIQIPVSVPVEHSQHQHSQHQHSQHQHSQHQHVHMVNQPIDQTEIPQQIPSQVVHQRDNNGNLVQGLVREEEMNPEVQSMEQVVDPSKLIGNGF